MKKILLLLLMLTLVYIPTSFAQEVTVATGDKQQSPDAQQKTAQTEEQKDIAYCNNCKWQGAESELKDEKCPKCGSANLTITRHVNLEEQQRLKDQQQTIEQLNRQREIDDMQRSIDNIRKINEFNQQQRNIEQINKINEQNRKR